jgi:hypothetical protein
MFLQQQYIFVEKYVKDFTCADYMIYCLNDLNTPILKLPCKQFSDLELQSIHHIREKDCIVFVLVSMKFHVHVTIFDDKSKLPEIHRYDADLFLKKKDPMVIVNYLEVPHKDDSGKVIKEYRQFFFVNSINQVQLLYPNYKDKFEKFRVIDLI